MRDDPISRLVKEGKLETSSKFTELTIEKLNKRLENRMKIKVYLLMVYIIVFIVFSTFVLISSGFKVGAFGFTINLPRILTILIISLICYSSILHLMTLLNSGFKKLNVN